VDQSHDVFCAELPFGVAMIAHALIFFVALIF